MASTIIQLITFCLYIFVCLSYPLDQQVNQTDKDFQPVPLPTDFGSYDLDGNGYIDLKELAIVSDTTDEEAKRPFVDADSDDDDQISPSEFEKAPWSLQGRLDEQIFPGDDIKEDRIEENINDDDDNNEALLDEDDQTIMMAAGEPVLAEGEGDDEEESVKEEPLDDEEDAPREESLTEYDDEEDQIGGRDDNGRDLEEESLNDEETNIGNYDDDDEEEEEEVDEQFDDDLDSDDINIDPLLQEDSFKETGNVLEEERNENIID